MNESITIGFGPGNSITKPAEAFPTLGHVLGDARLMAVLGASPDGVTATLNGVTATSSAILRGGDVIAFHTKAHEKAVVA